MQTMQREFDSIAVEFEKDQFGNELCRDFKNHHVYKGKVIFESEVKVWRVAQKMTAKEIRNGKFNPAFPLGPYECPNHDHYHVGHDAKNVGRTPPLNVKIRLWMEDTNKKIQKMKRKIRNRIAYHLRKI